MRFALAHQDPLVVGGVTGKGGPDGQPDFSLVSISDPNVLLWALKPAEEGIARVWDLADSPRDFTLGLAGGLQAAKRTTHIETDTGEARLRDGQLAAKLPAHRMQTYRLLPRRRRAPPAAGRHNQVMPLMKCRFSCSACSNRAPSPSISNSIPQSDLGLTTRDILSSSLVSRFLNPFNTLSQSKFSK